MIQSVVAGASISSSSSGQMSGLFEPGAVLEGSFKVGGASQIDAYLEGELLPYATLTDPSPLGSGRVIHVRIDLPQELPVGEQHLYVIAKESRPGGMVGGVAAAVRDISILVLDPEPRVEITSFGARSVALGDPSSEISLRVKSLTLQDLEGLYADLTMTALDGTPLATSRTNTGNLASFGELLLTGSVPTTDLDPGPYKVEATLFYAENSSEQSTEFRVGTLELFLESYTTELTRDTINKFETTLRSNWNQPLPGTYAIISIPPAEEQTPDVTIKAFGTENLKTYLDMEGAPLGNVSGTVTVFYEGGEKRFPVLVSLVDETVAAAEIVEEVATPGFTVTLTPMLLLYVLLILLVAINLLLLLRQRKGGKREGDQ
jgi:hypothetical protein